MALGSELGKCSKANSSPRGAEHPRPIGLEVGSNNPAVNEVKRVLQIVQVC